MKDSLNRDLQIGDRIAFVSCSCKNEFQQIETGTVEKLCDKYVRINKDEKIDEKYYNPKIYRFPNGVVYRKYDRIIKL